MKCGLLLGASATIRGDVENSEIVEGYVGLKMNQECKHRFRCSSLFLISEI